MSKPVIVSAVVLALAGGGYLATANHVGKVISAEVKQFETSLAQLDDVRVYRLTYEHGLFSGTVRYDLAFTPLADDPVHALLQDLIGPDDDASLRMEGEIAVRHGPWIGSGFGLAHFAGGIALPDALRDHLPQYPGQRPMIEADGVFGFDRAVDLTLRGIDYRGKLVDPASNTAGDLTFAGLAGRFGFDSGADWLDGSLRLDELSLALSSPETGRAAIAGIDLSLDVVRSAQGFWTGPASLSIRALGFSADEVDAELTQLSLNSTSRSQPGQDGQPRLAVIATGGIENTRVVSSGEGESARFIATGLTLDFDALQEWKAVWLGKATLALASLEGGDDNTDIHMSALSLSSDARLNGTLIDQTVHYQSGPIRINGVELGGGTLAFSLNGVRGDVIDELAQALEKYQDGDVPVFDTELETLLRSAVERLLAETVSLNLDPIGLNVEASNDITAHLRSTFNGAADLDFEDFPQLFNRLEIEAGFNARTSALQALTRIALQTEQARSGNTPPDPQALAREAEMRFQMMMLAARQTPYLVISDDAVQAEAALRNGRLSINGQDIGGVDDLALLGALAGGLFGGNDSDDSAGIPGPSGGAPQFDADPLYETVTLAANFDPDPVSIELIAGGELEIGDSLGEGCLGFINEERPDVVLDYTSGEFSLFIYAESSEDTTLVVRTPDGRWHCNDDGEGRGLDPTLVFARPLSGSYQIWAGTVASGAAEATLFLSEIDPTDR